MNTEFIYEDEQVVVFADIYPKATIHVLLTPKKHLSSLNALTDADTKLMGHIVCLLPKIAAQLGINSFRTIVNTGADSGQEIDHLHFHLLAGSLARFG